MKNTLAPGIPLAIVLSAAVATVALRAAARRQEPRWLPCTEPEPVTATAEESRPWPAVTVGTHDGAGHEMPVPPGRPPSSVEQTQYVFHELHPDGRNALCAVCDGQYRSA
jgi:hypothetical protein